MKKIIITPLFGIGDVIMTTPAIEILKKYLPDSYIVYFTFKKPIYEILKTNPYIDKIEYYPLLQNRITGLFYLIKNVSFRYDISITFYPSNRKDYNIFSFLTFAKQRLGYRYLKDDLKELNFLKNKTLKDDLNKHCVEKNVELLKFLNINVESIKIPDMNIFLSDEEIEKGLKDLKKYDDSNNIKIGIHIGTSKFKGHEKRRWSKEKFVELINRLYEFSFFLFGTKEEEEDNLYVLNNVKNKNVFLVNDKSIREVAGIINHLDLFLSNDSGLMHLASSLKRKVVGIFGPTNPNFVRPWTEKYRVVRLDLECSPCFYYSPKPLKCIRKDKKYKCLEDLSVDLVEKAVLDLLK